MLFQGQELLEDRWFDDTVALDWEKASTNRGILRLHRDLIALRRDRDGTTRGLRGPNVAILRADQAAKVLVMHRWMDGGPHDDTVVVANFADRTLDDLPIGFPPRAAGTCGSTRTRPRMPPSSAATTRSISTPTVRRWTAASRAASSRSARTASWSSPARTSQHQLLTSMHPPRAPARIVQ